MTVNDVLNYNQILKDIIDNAKDINALIKFRFLGMLKQFEPIVSSFEAIRNDKIKKYGTTKENGDVGIFEPRKEEFNSDEDYEVALKKYDDTMNKFINELSEVVNSEVETNIKKINYVDIMDAGIPADYLVKIYDIIEE